MRVQARVFGPVLAAVILSLLLLSLVPAITRRCWSAVDSRMGNLPVALSLTVAVLVLSFL